METAVEIIDYFGFVLPKVLRSEPAAAVFNYRAGKGRESTTRAVGEPIRCRS